MVTETRTRQSPEFEAAQEQYIDLLTKQVGRAPGTGGVPTLAQLGPQVAAVDPLTQAAQQQAATQAGLGQLTFDPTTGAVTGVGTGTGVAGFQPFLDQAQQFQTAAAGLTGPTAFQQFLSPYQQQVIDATLRDFDKQAAVDRARTLQQAGMGTVGNLDAGRFGVQLAEQGAQSNLDRAALQARLLQSGFTQASDLASRAQQQQLGLGEFSRGLASLQPSLASSTQQQLGGAGTGALAFQQALLDAEQQRQQLAYQEPLSRIQALGSGLASQVGGVPTTTQTLGTPAPQASPLSQALQVGLTAYGLGSLFGRG
jgi:hypothetical protein|tara:strand:+ start:238 stop:1173 length:936 start_codon:yes stop_codon:yes gene_type:complete